MRWTKLLSLIVLPALALALMCTSALAAADGWRTPFPDIPKGKGDRCVMDTAFMRANHMELLLHQRDQTVQRGIRTQRFSLKGCVSCHAVAGDDGKLVGYDSPKNFCRVCHDYAAVRIDCFECHASKPPEDEVPGAGRAAGIPLLSFNR